MNIEFALDLDILFDGKSNKPKLRKSESAKG